MKIYQTSTSNHTQSKTVRRLKVFFSSMKEMYGEMYRNDEYERKERERKKILNNVDDQVSQENITSSHYEKQYQQQW